MGVKLLASSNGSVELVPENTASNFIVTVPAATTTMVGTDATQTLTNKTIQGGSITSGTAVASTSGTSINFTGIPSWVKRITVMFNNVSTSSTSGLLTQIGAGSVETTGYLSASFQTSSSTSLLSTTGFAIFNNSAGDNMYGPLVLTLFGSNNWQASGVQFKDSGGDYLTMTSGTKTLSGTLDRVRITTVNGTDTFDAGSINILYE